MHIYISVVIFFLGLALASFFNALLYRIDNGYKYPDIYIKGSHCEKCGKRLTWYELIPVLSFLIFRGKCKQCGYKVPMYYPVSELVLALSLSFIFYFSLPWTFYLVVLFLFSLSYFDRIYKEIPQDIVHAFLIFGFLSFVILTILNGSIINNSLLLSSIFSLSVYVLSKVIKKDFGMGDLLVIFTLGFFLTISQFMSFLYIFLGISLLYSLTLILLKRATIKSAIPLLPVMYISFCLMVILNMRLEIILESILFI